MAMRLVFGVDKPPELVYVMPADLPLECDLTALSVAALGKRITRLEAAADAALEMDAFDQVDAIWFAVGEAKFTHHQRTRKALPRCKCGALLPLVPDDQMLTDEGDNLDRRYCKRCGETNDECY